MKNIQVLSIFETIYSALMFWEHIVASVATTSWAELTAINFTWGRALTD